MVDPMSGVEARSASRSVVLPLLAALLLVPSTDIALFSGLPVDGNVEFLAALCLLPLIFCGEVRRRWSVQARRLSTAAFRVLAAMIIAALAAKIVLLLSDEPPGFRACYRSLVTPPVERPKACEVSYDNPLSRHGVTRLDATIDFEARPTRSSLGMIPADPWNLDFFNSNRFNFYAWRDGVPDRAYLPFAVDWQGEIAESAPTRYSITYVGEVTIQIADAKPMVLRRSYDSARVARIDVPPGRRDVRIEYRYARQVLRPEPPPDPFAALVVKDQSGDPVRAALPARHWQLLSQSADVVTGALALSLAATVLLVLGRTAIVVPAAALAAFGGIRAPSIGPHVVGFLEVALLGLGLHAMVRRRWSRTTVLLASFITVVALELVRAHHDLGSFDAVFLRPGGDDFLTYESQAHAVLGGSLRGEEDVFVYSPAFRYLLALGHVIFGNGDARLSVATLTALSMAVIAMVTAWTQRSTLSSTCSWSDARLSVFGFVAAASATLMLAVSPAVTAIIRAPLSEFPTWVLVPTGLLLVTHAVSTRRLVLAAVLVALALTIRANHAPGLIVTTAVGGLAIWSTPERSRRWRSSATALCLASLLLVAALPAVHNIIYGSRFVPFADSASIAMNVPLPPTDVFEICCDSNARATFASQARGVTVIGTPAPIGFVLNIRMIQLAWLVSLVLLWVRRRKVGAASFLIAAMPVALLAPHLFFQVHVYYPRHIILGYLVMGLAAAYVFSAVGRRHLAGDVAPRADAPAASPVVS